MECHIDTSVRMCGMEIFVFVSYAHEDDVFALALVERLEILGIRCWVAPRDIPVASDYSVEIVKAVSACSALIVVLSVASAGSRHVLSEVSHAFNAEKRIAPVQIDGTTIGPPLEYFLSQSQRLDAHGMPADVVAERLAESLAALVGSAESESPSATGRCAADAAPPHTARTLETIHANSPVPSVEEEPARLRISARRLVGALGGICGLSCLVFFWLWIRSAPTISGIQLIDESKLQPGPTGKPYLSTLVRRENSNYKVGGGGYVMALVACQGYHFVNGAIDLRPHMWLSDTAGGLTVKSKGSLSGYTSATQWMNAGLIGGFGGDHMQHAVGGIQGLLGTGYRAGITVPFVEALLPVDSPGFHGGPWLLHFRVYDNYAHRWSNEETKEVFFE
jgi:TIR domain-containing protein